MTSLADPGEIENTGSIPDYIVFSYVYLSSSPDIPMHRLPLR
jgi:hypothetical protein